MESSPEGNLSQYEYDDFLAPVDHDGQRRPVHLYESVHLGGSDILPRDAAYAAPSVSGSVTQ